MDLEKAWKDHAKKLDENDEFEKKRPTPARTPKIEKLCPRCKKGFTQFNEKEQCFFCPKCGWKQYVKQ